MCTTAFWSTEFYVISVVSSNSAPRSVLPARAWVPGTVLRGQAWAAIALVALGRTLVGEVFAGFAAGALDHAPQPTPF